MFTNTSVYAYNVDFVMTLIVGIAVVLLLGVTFTMIYFLIKFNHKKNPKATQIKNHTLLEIIWIVVPILLVLVMFYYGYVVFLEGRKIPKDSMEIKVEARMWKWKFTYPNGKVTDTLFVPQNQNIVFRLSSVDVVHSFYIPAFRIKEDAVPYKSHYMVLNPDKIGIYDIACAEYCGVNHSLMYTKMYVISKQDYNNWYYNLLSNNEIRNILGESTSKINPLKIDKFAILNSKACTQCHSTNGTKLIGPSFTELSRGTTKVMVNGKEETVKIDKDYILESIKNPQSKIVSGYDKILMPEQMKLLNEKEIDQIVNILMDNFVKVNK